MPSKTAIRSAAVGVVALALLGGSATAAMATETNGSDGPYYLYDSGTETRFADNHVYAWDDDLVGSTDPSNAQALFTCPADATSVQSFVSPVGTERNRSTWVAYSDGGFMPGTKTILEPNASLYSEVLGSAAQVKSAGGNYSLGVACLKDNSVNFASAGVWYSNIAVTAGTGAWTYTVPTVVTPPPPASGTFDQNLSAPVVVVPEALNLVAPTNATTTLGTATIVNKLSTSVGKLGQFSVEDTRYSTHPGWTLTTSVADFALSTDASKTIDKKQLGVAPLVISSPAGSAVTAAAATIAGTATNPSPFAAASNSATIGTSVLDADLTFVAPLGTPAGTYTSKLTVTLASK
ncbi:hypothetical protein BH09ACT6_BH09ACT6_25050 [soil metagenome]